MSIVDILSSPPGGLAYHLIMLFAIQAVLGMALDEAGRSHQPRYRRIAIAFGILFLSRLFLMAVALVTWQGFVPPQGVLPPLERFLDLLGITLLFYAISPNQDRLAATRRMFVVANLLLALVVYLVFAVLWYSALRISPELHYNGYWQEYVWELWQMVISIMALVMVLRQSVQQKVLASSILITFLLGHIVHILSLQGAPHVAGWDRVANIIIYPLFAAMTYRANAANWGAQKKMAETTADRQDSRLRDKVIGARGTPPQDAMQLETAGHIGGSLELPLVLQRATENVMTAFDVDLIALLIRRVASSKSLEIAAVRHRSGLYETSKGQIDLSEMPMLRRVLQKQKQIVPRREDDDAEEWGDLLEQIGAPPDHNLIVHPLVAREISIGILVIADHSLSQLSPVKNDQRMAYLSSAVASAVGNALLHEATLTRLNDLDTQLHAMEQQIADRGAETDMTPPSGAEGHSDQQLIELWQAQLEFERVRRETSERSAEADRQLVAALQEEISQLQAALADARSQHPEPLVGADVELIERLEAELEKSRQELQHTYRELEEARLALEERSEDVDAELTERLEAELEKSRQELQRTYRELEEARLALEERPEDVDAELTERLEAELEKSRQELQRTYRELEEARLALQERPENVDAELTKRLETELEKSYQELKLTQQELEKAHKQLREQDVAHLEAELAQAHLKLEQAHQQLAEQSFGVNLGFVEQLQIELEQARQEHARLQEQVDRPDVDFVEHLQAELEQAQRELQLMSKELYQRAPEPDLGLIEHLQSELAQARFDVEQMRENLRKTEETTQYQEEELNKRAERIDELGVMLQSQNHEGHLISTIIHQDLRMPLKLLEGYTDLLLGGSLGFLEESQVKFVQRVKSNVERMRNVLDNLDLLAMIDSGTLKIEPADINVSSFIDNVIAQSKAQTGEKQIGLKINVPSNLPVLRADMPKLEQVMNNLLSNAIKCSPPASEVRVFAEARKDNDRKHRMLGPFITVSIEDAGGGIDPKQQSSVFDRPEQIERYPIKGLGERGIGLVVAKELIEAQGGKIWFETKTGVGTTFTFALPINGDDVRARSRGVVRNGTTHPVRR